MSEFASESSADEILLLYFEALGRGEKPNLEAILADHPGSRASVEARLAAWGRAEAVLLSAASELDRGTKAHLTDESIASSPWESLLARLASRAFAKDRYVRLGVFARGGMGAIEKARDLDLDRTIAIKVIAPRGEVSTKTIDPSPRLIGRFLREARVTARLDHPGIVPVHELGLDDRGRIYFTMKLVEGEELSGIFCRVREQTPGWTLVRALGILQKVCETMAFAHSKGVIHRDLKPQNIMVGLFGEVYVMDWGLANDQHLGESADIRVAADMDEELDAAMVSSRDGESSPLLTYEGQTLGTPAYMSPEQATGQLDSMGPRSDVYSVGAILYHLLAGQAPYADIDRSLTQREVLARVKAGPPDRLDLLARTQPRELIAICDKAMARNPADRHASMEELSDSIANFLQDRVVTEFEGGAWAQFRKWVKRNRRSVATIVIATACVASVSLVLYSAAVRAEKHRTYVANVLAAGESLRANLTDEAKRLLGNCDTSLQNNWEWRHLHAAADTSLHVIQRDSERHESGAIAGLDFSPDGTRLASCETSVNLTGMKTSDERAQSRIRLWDTQSWQQVLEVIHDRESAGIAFSADGTHVLACCMKPELHSWSLNGDEQQRIEIDQPIEGLFGPLAVQGKSGIIALSCGDSTVRLLDLARPMLRRHLRGPFKGIARIAFNSNGTMLAAGSGDATCVIWDMRTQEVLGKCFGHTDSVAAVGFTSDDACIVTGSWDGTVRAWSASTQKQLWSASCDGSLVLCVSIAPDDAMIAVGCSDRIIRLLELETGRLLGILRGHDEAVTCVKFHPSGSVLASGSVDGTIRIWDTLTNQATSVLSNDSEPIASLDFSPKNDQIVAGANDRTIQLWSASTLHLKSVLTDPTGNVCAVQFGSSGEMLCDGAQNDFIRVRPSGRLTAPRLIGDATCDPHTVAISPDGHLVAALTTDLRLRVWDVSSGEELFQRGEPATSNNDRGALAFSPNGRQIATTAPEGCVALWDVSAARRMSLLRGHQGKVLSLSFSPDGSLLASGAKDRTICLWDLQRESLVYQLQGQANPVRSVRFHPVEPRLASSGDDDGTVRIWDTDLGDCVAILHGPVRAVNCLAFSPDGERLAGGVDDGSVFIWETSPVSVRCEAKRNVEEIRSQAEPLANAYFEEGRTSSEILGWLKKNTSLPASIRDCAIEVAITRTDAASLLNCRAWNMVLRSGRPLEYYQRAASLASAALYLLPKHATPWPVLQTLGCARYRAHDYYGALGALVMSDILNGGDPATVAFMAMTQEHLGRHESAVATLEQLECAMPGHPIMTNIGIDQFWREARGLILR